MRSRERVAISLLCTWDSTLALQEGVTACIHTPRLHTLLRNSSGLANSSTSRNKLLRMKPLLTRVDWTMPTPPNPRCAFVQISLTEQLDRQGLHGQVLTAEETSHQFSSHSWDWSGNLCQVYVLDWEKATGMCCSVYCRCWVGRILSGKDRTKVNENEIGSVLILNYSTLCCWCNPSKPAISSWPLFYEQSYSSFDNKRNTGG